MFYSKEWGFKNDGSFRNARLCLAEKGHPSRMGAYVLNVEPGT